MLTTGFGTAVCVLIGGVEDCAGGGGPVGTLAAFGTICGLLAVAGRQRDLPLMVSL